MKTLTLKEIDVLIGTRIMGFAEQKEGGVLISLIDEPAEWTYFMSDEWREWSPTTNIEDAWEVVDKLSKNYGVELYQDSVFKRECKIHRLGDDVIETEADTMPLAICKAALETQGIEVQVDANEISNDI